MRKGKSTTHEWARRLLADIDCPLDWPCCRKCGKRMDPNGREYVSMGATCIGESCYVFHHTCWDEMTDAEKAEGNKVSSTLFPDGI